MNASIIEAGFNAETYVGSLRNYRSFVRTLMGEARANAEHVAALAAAVAGAPGPVTATLMTEDWCGDAACNLPILASLLGGAGIDLRIVRGSEQPSINDYYNNLGVDHIPVLSIWDGEFNELVRWIEAPAAMTLKKDVWKAERPEFMELYRKQKEDKEAAKKFAGLYRGFMDEMKEWYKTGMWDETTREIAEAAHK
jgi:thioredoxin family protein